jgi:hypothetical protein
MSRWIHATRLIELLQRQVRLHWDETGVEINAVGNLLVSNETRHVGFIDMKYHEFFSIDESRASRRNSETVTT